MDLRPGNTVKGPDTKETYKVIRPIGSGGFGIVYEISDTTGVRYALKTIQTGLMNDMELDILLNEGRLALTIAHDNVIRVFYFHDGSVDPSLPPYLLMELADGGTLQDELNARRQQQAFLSNEDLVAIYLQLASGMKAINEKLVHRDIKPDNILKVGDSLKISDFGLSKLVGAATRSHTFKGINHIRYCAPEAWRLEENLPSMDMYSMGIVFYEIATLQHPLNPSQQGDPIQEWKESHFFQVPEDPRIHNRTLKLTISQLIMKMLAKRPEDRYFSWDELIERLKSVDLEPHKEINVTSLLNHAMKIKYEKEKSRLKAEAEAICLKEYDNFMAYSFTEITQAADNTVEAFNSSSETYKLFVGKKAGSHLILVYWD
jgi:serine/threonine protein kinase